MIAVLMLPAAIAIAVALYIDSPGPLIFRQRRTGLGGTRFALYKFRTMHPQACTPGFVQATADDTRTTFVGRLLRRSSLDELPQLFNVLRGEMSLVGPRPHVPEMDEELAAQIENYWDRYTVKPGLTGLAQINGCRGPTPTIGHARRRIALDRLYVRKWSLWLDLKILLATPFRLFGPNAV